jgi:NAD(P)-dependent dehydrogenase (short-subunit alcohol dehydrogenase family)
MADNVVTIVTGGGRGIGRAIALRMARETPVMVVGRTAADLRNVCAEIRAAGGIAMHCTGDVATPGTARRCVDQIHRSKRVVRHLVCNAGIAKGGDTHAFDPRLADQMMRVNYTGTMNFAIACLPDMLAEGDGTICLMSSVLGVRGYKRETAYAATKHALVGMARSLAHEYSRKGIRVVPLCPGFVESEMTQRSIDGLVRYRGISESEARAVIASANAGNRIIPAEEVAEMVARVCSGEQPVNGEPLLME